MQWSHDTHEKELTGNNGNNGNVVNMLDNEAEHGTRRTVTPGYENEGENVSVLTMEGNANGEKEPAFAPYKGVKKLDREVEHDTATRKVSSEHKQKRAPSSTIVSSADKKEKELPFENATSEAQTSQDCPDNTSAHVSMGIARERDVMDDHWDSSSVRAEQCSTSEAEGRGQKYAPRRKQLITLDTRNGNFEPPTVFKKTFTSQPGKPVSVQQPLKRTHAPLADDTKLTEQERSIAEKELEGSRMFDYKESLQREAESQDSEKNFQSKCKPKKKVRFNLDQGAVGGKPEIGTNCPVSSTAHSRPEKKLSTYIQQFQALTYNDWLPGTSSDLLPPLPDTKPKWHDAGPCLPSIKQEKKQMVEDFLSKHKRKKEVELKKDFEGWGEPEPEQLTRFWRNPFQHNVPATQHTGIHFTTKDPMRGVGKDIV